MYLFIDIDSAYIERRNRHESRELFIYCGHGAGEKLIDSIKIRKLLTIKMYSQPKITYSPTYITTPTQIHIKVSNLHILHAFLDMEQEDYLAKNTVILIAPQNLKPEETNPIRHEDKIVAKTVQLWFN